MCGIAGIFSPSGRPADKNLLVRMARSIRHRGPDDEGFLLSRTGTSYVRPFRGCESRPEIGHADIDSRESADHQPNLALAWRRLSIIDLSPTGHQPMTDANERVWVVFNGEIYNYIELREELRAKGFAFRTHSDTEVIIHAYNAWGSDCVRHLNGMWSFALYDAARGKLFCSRDRFGIKPFYYVWDGTTLFFASEIKALLESADIQRTANEGMVYDYLAHRILDHSDQTFFDVISQLKPGNTLELDPSGLQIRQYYELSFNPDLGRYDDAEARKLAGEFRERFTDSVRIHLRTDVTLGSCLSGGLDSSSIVCTANQLIFGSEAMSRSIVGDKQKTFTATYSDARFSEEPFVQSVINQTHASPFFIEPTSAGLLTELSAFVRAHDEPVISTSMYAQWNVMKLAAEHNVKVMLDGQGGDELLGGYRWHFPVFHGQLLKALRFGDLAAELRSTSAVTGISMTELAKPVFQKVAKTFIPRSMRPGLLEISPYLDADFIRKNGTRASALIKSDFNLQQRLWEEETKFNLQQLLHYEDRNSMAFSIEARVPFVEYRLVEFVMNVPAVYKIRGGWSKHLLRTAMEGMLPKDIQWRKDKMGFVTPEQAWMRELQGDFLNILQREPMRSGRFVDTAKYLNDLRLPSSPMQTSDVWRLLNLELWMREFKVS
jgi:asparagine synthase (glutamine-hydrolysing)